MRLDVARPTVSVLMPAYNVERFIVPSVQSVLAQTFEDFELVVVNDCSTDNTLGVLGAIQDQRIRIIDNPTNLGIVGAGNRAMAAARGRYIARLDADDLCLPTRFAKQVAVLDRNPGTVLVCTEQSIMERGRLRRSRHSPDTDPIVLKWMLHVSNPVGNPSLMFRRDAVAAMGCFLREEFCFAEDFDFLHRLLRQGDFAVIPEYLTIYRHHEQNNSRLRRTELIERTGKVLTEVYKELLGGDRTAEGQMVAAHLVACEPAVDRDRLRALGRFLNELIGAFGQSHSLTDQQRHKIRLHTSNLWWRVAQATIAAGHGLAAKQAISAYDWEPAARPGLHRVGRSVAVGLVRRAGKGRARKSVAPPPRQVAAQRDAEDGAPVLYIVVDTEAEFDWRGPFARSATRVTAMREQGEAQAIFDHYGARPIYVVDYAVASQEEGYGPLKEWFDRHACAIGAHLHPWINPPFEEATSERNSFAGNLPPDLEERKVRALVDVIERNFGTSPLFFKAGRYGIGPHTTDMLTRLGFAVDFSILPLADLRAKGGPDFRFADMRPGRAGAGQLLTVPMTRGQLGLLSPLPPRLHGALRSPLATKLRIPGVLSRTRLLNTVTLTPEGVSTPEQIQLIRTMVDRGHRTFVLHYHSPSLGGFTPYVTTNDERTRFIDRLRGVCEFFFETMGGMPGNPPDLVPPEQRRHVWPDRDGRQVDVRAADFVRG